MHRISAAKFNVDPESASLKEMLLSFIQLKEDHSGKKIAKEIDNSLKKLEIPWSKVITLLI